jgi:AraC-like DNA-binding protein
MHGMTNIFCALPSWKLQHRTEVDLPEGASITHRPIEGKRIHARNHRSYGKMSVEEYCWPKDKLISARVPKLCFVTKGFVAYQIADYVLHCRPFHGILLPPGVPFPDGKLSVLDTQYMDNRACELFMILPRQGSLNCWSSQLWIDNHNVIQHKHITCSVLQSQVAPLLHRLVEEAQEQKLYWEDVGGALLLAMLMTLHREMRELPIITTGNFNGRDLGDVSQPALHPIARAEEYIRRNLSKAPTTGDVARHVYLSRTTFVTQFHARTGKTYTQYINDYRFEQICNLLEGGDLSISHISKYIGVTERYLRTLIRQHTGLTPTSLRDQLRNAKK